MTQHQNHQGGRLERGGRLDRDQSIGFTIDGTALTGYVGDTLASALVANGRLRVGDSIYLRRPRGVLSAGVEEPNGFVRVNGDHNESMLPATTLELRDGLDVTLLDGIGVLDDRPDRNEYDKMHVHADVAVIGSGPAGLAAAKEAASGGARVVLFEQDFELGGSLLSDPTITVAGQGALDYIARVRAELEAAPEVTVLTRTCVFGSYDNNFLVALEKRDEVASAKGGVSRQRLWHVTAGQVVLAVGAFERPIVFSDNDVPGVMLASAVKTYVERWAALPGRDVVLFTTNDSAYETARCLTKAGATVTVVDARPEVKAAVSAQEGARRAGLTVHTASAVVGIEGSEGVTGAFVAPIDDAGQLAGDAQLLACDLVAVSGGWTPNVSLHSQRQGQLAWDDALSGFVPSAGVKNQFVVGAGNGTYDTDDCLIEGARAGRGAAAAAGFPASSSADDGDAVAESAEVWHARQHRAAGTVRPLWAVPAPDGSLDTHFVDPHRDNTAADVLRATGAGMRSVEHVKRYTSISTGIDQGKIGGVNTIGLLTQLLSGNDAKAIPAGQPGQDAAEEVELTASGQPARRPTPGTIGTTTFRAPFTPVAFTALAGRGRGTLFDAARTSPAHSWHVEHGARFEDVGQWKRPWFYPQEGEDMDAAVARECRAAREGVAFMDATTLGKIEIRGADAPEFLNRIYTNPFLKLPVGKGRYGVMCTVSGMVFDDGVTLRLADDRFFMTTTTGGAAKVLDWLEEWSQTEWPELDVTLTSVTEQWSTVAVVGPRSRDVIAKLAPELDVSKEGFGFMEFRETTLASGIDARVCRITFSGELAYEINVPRWYGLKVWEDVAAAGEEFGITPYGTETMHVLRAEKAFPIVGQETDGTITPHDLGMDWVVSKTKEFIGKRSFSRAAFTEPGRKQLVSVLPLDHTLRLPEGAQLIEPDALGDYTGEGLPSAPIAMVGFVTSSYHSQALGRSFALALVKDGPTRVGQTLLASFGGQFTEVEVREPVLYDKEGARRDG
ncbi:MAG: FAD-dependent oxidoreductase [Humibacillus sp.]|nr:FAD-dependent oxidoreductase [Humibacillus sp.]MDN5775590.1 FAD-dependent oxidoreductase [Humibacillus sp.]